MLARLFLVAVYTLCLSVVAGEDGDAGHFQVHNEQEGSLKIHATKEIAQIETQANSVQVVLEPGKVNAPVVENTGEGKGKVRKLVKIINPVYMSGLKRSRVNKAAGKSSGSNRLKRALLEGVKMFENSVMLEKWMEENSHIARSNGRRGNQKSRRSTANLRKYKKENMRSKKSEIDKETRVRGRTGGLHVTTGKKGTKLISKGGALNVFIRNEKEDHTEEVKEENSDRRSNNDNYHVIDSNMVGLSLKRDVVKKRTKCLIPPCMP